MRQLKRNLGYKSLKTKMFKSKITPIITSLYLSIELWFVDLKIRVTLRLPPARESVDCERAIRSGSVCVCR